MLPMRLDAGWNQIQFNLSDFARRAYGTNYIETHRIQVRTQPPTSPAAVNLYHTYTTLLLPTLLSDSQVSVSLVMRGL